QTIDLRAHRSRPRRIQVPAAEHVLRAGDALLQIGAPVAVLTILQLPVLRVRHHRQDADENGDDDREAATANDFQRFVANEIEHGDSRVSRSVIPIELKARRGIRLAHTIGCLDSLRSLGMTLLTVLNSFTPPSLPRSRR